MTRRGLGIAGKAILWVVLAVVGLISLVVVGWVPPELAAMLGSRRSAGDIDVTPGPDMPSGGPPVERSRGRG